MVVITLERNIFKYCTASTVILLTMRLLSVTVFVFGITLDRGKIEGTKKNNGTNV